MVVVLDAELSGGRAGNDLSEGWDDVVTRGSKNGERLL
jgi:hypothetical protein